MGMDLQSGPKRSVRPSMNVAPLVDVVLVLLIIFMVITPMLTKQLSVNVPNKPEDKAEPPPPNDPNAELQIVLWVDKDGKARINKDIVADADLPTRLRRVFAARKDQTLFFDAANEAPFGRALQVLDTARGAGLLTIAVLTEPLAGAE
jgi:biopolymer transport protein TolR